MGMNRHDYHGLFTWVWCFSGRGGGDKNILKSMLFTFWYEWVGISMGMGSSPSFIFPYFFRIHSMFGVHYAESLLYNGRYHVQPEVAFMYGTLPYSPDTCRAGESKAT